MSVLLQEFKLNPNAKSFTPSFPRPASPMIQNQVYLQTPAMPVGVNLNQFLQQQQAQPAQFAQDGNGLGGASVSAAPYLQQLPGSYAPGVPGAGGPPVLPGQPSMKVSPQPQQVCLSSLMHALSGLFRPLGVTDFPSVSFRLWVHRMRSNRC